MRRTGVSRFSLSVVIGVVVLVTAGAAQERRTFTVDGNRVTVLREALAADQATAAEQERRLLTPAQAAEQRKATVEATLEFIAGEPSLAAMVRGAPYSAEATTSVTQQLADGTRIERTSVTRVYRDGEGRVRREQTVLGLGALTPAGDAPAVITITDPVAGVSYLLDPATKKARRTQFGRLEVRRKVEDGDVPPPPPPPGQRGGGMGGRVARGSQVPNAPQSLGTRQIEGVTAVGTKRTETIPVGRIGNDRPIEITDERWESPELKVLLLSRHHDPRTGDVEYRLTGISRAEPPHHFFQLPPDYTIVDGRDERR